ncbi:hypothetical protein ACMG4P_10775 [Pseudovibrio denitrificans]|uniref:hypothetical protein n=1 Tax=Pseudovibrio denitrificans TaxID=258256 RepID=UPI0039BFBCA7
MAPSVGTNLSITDYKVIPTLLRSIALNVDRDRDLQQQQPEESTLFSTALMPMLGLSVTQADDYEYITDGRAGYREKGDNSE